MATVAFMVASGTTIAKAQDASPWKGELHAAARLIAGATRRFGDVIWLRAGVEIRLDPGWHTYWRSPGDSGVPPTFDFAASGNVKSVNVLWPAPKRFPDGAGGHFNGYVKDVVFPLRIAARDMTEPSLLHLKLTYAYCNNICYPAEADLALDLSGKGGAEEQTLVAAEARVPHRVPLGTAGLVAIRSVHLENSDGGKRIVVEVAAPQGAAVELFAEGPVPGWALPPPQEINALPRDAMRRFTFQLDGIPPGTKADDATLTFTAVSLGEAIEVIAHPQ